MFKVVTLDLFQVVILNALKDPRISFQSPGPLG